MATADAVPMWTPRPKGFASWRPHRKTMVLMEQVRAILDEYSDELPLTLRQIFYRLVGQYGFEKTERAYLRLGEYLVRARRSGMIPFGAIRDVDNAQGGSGWDDFAQYLRSELDGAEGYERDRMAGQPHAIELWSETTGMVPQLARAVAGYHVAVRSANLGFASITLTRQIAARALREERPTMFMHVGDFDPSGQSIYQAMAEDAGMFVEQLRDRDGHPDSAIIPVRVALTPEQVAEYDLPTAPPKPSDTRSRNWEGETCQLEAMAPSDITAIVRDAVHAALDHDIRNKLLREEKRERATATRMIRRMLADADPDNYSIDHDDTGNPYAW